MVGKSARLELRVTREFLDAIDAARGDVSRTRWVERALEKALGPTVGGVTASESPAGAVPASSRVPARPSPPGPASEVLPPLPVFACPMARCRQVAPTPVRCPDHPHLMMKPR